MTLKNISNIDCLQFYRWITTLKYWQRYLDHLTESHPLVNHEPVGPAGRLVGELVWVVRENLGQAVQVMGLQRLLEELTCDYINVYHKVSWILRRICATTKLSIPCRRIPGSRRRYLRSLVKYCS